MRVVLFADAERSFEFVLCFLEGTSIDADDVAMLSKLAADELGQGDNDAIITGIGIVVKVDEGFEGAK